MADIVGVRATPELDTIETTVICDREGGQIDPRVDFDGENFIVVWSDYDIRVARVTPQGAVLDTGNIVGEGMTRPHVVCGETSTLVVWCRDYYGVYGRFIDSNGLPSGAPILVSTTFGSMTVPTAAYGNSNYLVVWADFCSTGTHQDIHGQLVDTEGQLIGDRLVLAQGEQNQHSSNVVFDGINYLVIWNDGEYDIHGQMVRTDGQLSGPPFRISDSGIRYRNTAAAAVGSTNYLVAWNEWYDDYDIYGNVDLTIGVEEVELENFSQSRPTTVLNSHNLSLLRLSALYDVAGRAVKLQDVKTGVYFALRGGLLTKVVVVD